jgi:hypothetical protein
MDTPESLQERFEELQREQIEFFKYFCSVVFKPVNEQRKEVDCEKTY